MTVYQIDPLHDPRWSSFILDHPRASVFHTPGWLEALRRAYRYEPFVLTTSPPGRELENGVVFCRVNSLFTGRRLVSLPFSDHCEPLVDHPEDMDALLYAAERELRNGNLRYVELRPANPYFSQAAGFVGDQYFWSHAIDLHASLPTLFSNLHKNCVQRKIRRAQRAALTYKSGTSESLLKHFYYLVLLTRRRQGLPPQPLVWFQQLIDCLRESVTMHIAYKDSRPIAGILTLSYKNVLLYKYGASDKSYSTLGGTQLLFWRALVRAKNDNIRQFDLGRTDCHNTGLATFKDRLGATRSPLTYWRCPGQAGTLSTKWAARTGKLLCTYAPGPVLATIGSAVYKHAG